MSRSMSNPQNRNTSSISTKYSRGSQKGRARRILRSVTLFLATALTMVVYDSAAKANCIGLETSSVESGPCFVLNTTPVSSLSGTVGPSITNFSTNVANTSFVQSGPAVNVLLGTFGANPTLDPLTLTNSSTLTITVNLSGTGATLTPPTLNLVGTYNVALASFTFAPVNVSFITEANTCGSFDVTVNPLALTSLLAGGTLDATLSNTACATCNGTPAPVPEPATLLLLGSGLVSLGARLRKRRRSKEE